MTFEQGLRAQIVMPGDIEYAMARREWNRAIQRFPAAIVFCETVQDVSATVCWARRHNMPLRIRNGRHNYEGYSTGQGVIVLDLSRMNAIKPDNGILTVQGGATNHDVYEALAPLGVPFPGGTCPTVGVMGYALGGGWGLSCRPFGLGCDNLESVCLINADGRLIKADREHNFDMFWALRGAGNNNFGVAVEASFRLPPAVDTVTLVQLYYPDTDAAAQVRFIEMWQKWIARADDRVTLQASVYYGEPEEYAVYSRGLFYGSPEEAKEAVAPLAELPGCQATFDSMTFNAAMTRIGASYPESEKFKSTGRFVIKPLEVSQIARLVTLMRDHAPGSVFAALSLYALGGRVAHVDPHATAFYFRQAQYILLIQSVWREDRYARENIEWVNRRFPYLQSVTAGSYVNFPFAGLRDYEHAYYGGNVPWLRIVKQKYDPCHVFRYPQSIRVLR